MVLHFIKKKSTIDLWKIQIIHNQICRQSLRGQTSTTTLTSHGYISIRIIYRPIFKCYDKLVRSKIGKCVNIIVIDCRYLPFFIHCWQWIVKFHETHELLKSNRDRTFEKALEIRILYERVYQACKLYRKWKTNRKKTVVFFNKFVYRVWCFCVTTFIYRYHIARVRH